MGEPEGQILFDWPLPFAVPHSDVDHAGIVFYARVHTWCHIAYEEWYTAALGVPFPTMFTERGFGTPVVSSHTEYYRPIRHGERLQLVIHCERLGQKSFSLAFAIRDLTGATRAVVRVTHATIKFPEFEAMLVPEDLRDALSRKTELMDD